MADPLTLLIERAAMEVEGWAVALHRTEDQLTAHVQALPQDGVVHQAVHAAWEARRSRLTRIRADQEHEHLKATIRLTILRGVEA
jgi:hypothetical protein